MKRMILQLMPWALFSTSVMFIVEACDRKGSLASFVLLACSATLYYGHQSVTQRGASPC